MKVFRAALAAAFVVACGDSSGPGVSPWLGSWSLQWTVPGYIVSPQPTLVTLRDSAATLYAATPAWSLTDSGYTDPVDFSQNLAVQNSAAARDSLALSVNGYGMITQFLYTVRLLGVRNGSNASGTVTLVPLGYGSGAVIGTWTASKQ